MRLPACLFKCKLATCRPQPQQKGGLPVKRSRDCHRAAPIAVAQSLLLQPARQSRRQGSSKARVQDCRLQGGRPVRGAPFKPLLVVLDAGLHIHAKHWLEVFWKGVWDVKAGDLWCSAAAAAWESRQSRKVSISNFDALQGVQGTMPDRTKGRGGAQARDGLNPWHSSQSIHSRLEGGTCSMARRNASQDARSESTSTPSQSKMR